MPTASRQIFIGISGWSYPRWRRNFYPEGLPHDLELAYASRLFSTVEVNGSFYSLLHPSIYERWRDAVPPGFLFSVKGSRYITHLLRLKGIHRALANFFASGVLALGRSLGPILWQLPPTLPFSATILEEFLSSLPRTMASAAVLARDHDQRVAGRAFTEPSVDAPLRYVVEVRHPSFVDPDFIRILRSHRVAPCISDSAGRYPIIEDTTAEFVYVRLHGASDLYTSGYDRPALEAWAERIATWADGGQPEDAALASPPAAHRHRRRKVFVYFDNDAKVRAPFDALALADRLAKSSGAIPPDSGKEALIPDACKQPESAQLH